MKTAAPAKPEEEKGDALILSVKLLSGRFDSSIQVPLKCTDEERKAFVDAWLVLIEAGVKCGRSKP